MTKEAFNKKTRTEKVKFLCSKKVIPIVEIPATDWDGTISYTANVILPTKGDALDLTSDYYTIEERLQETNNSEHIAKVDDFIRLNGANSYYKAFDKAIKMAYYLFSNGLLLF